jgi:hypothetical protein
MLTLDPMSELVNEHFAVIYTPSQRRKRFPDNCVELVDSLQQARQLAAEEENRHAAVVMGPSRSSEGFMLYYLVRWV